MGGVAATVQRIKELSGQDEEKMLKIVLRDAIIMYVTHGEAMCKNELDRALAGPTSMHPLSSHLA